MRIGQYERESSMEEDRGEEGGYGHVEAADGEVASGTDEVN